MNKLFNTTNRVGYNVRYHSASTTISGRDNGGVCLTMVLTWLKAALLHDAAGLGRGAADTENELTGGGPCTS